MKRHVFMLATVLLLGEPGCDQNDDDYVKTFKGDVIHREDALDSRASDEPAVDAAGSNEEETPGEDGD